MIKARKQSQVGAHLPVNTFRLLLAACAVLALCASTPLSLCAQPSPTEIISHMRVNATRDIDFHAAVFPDTVYAGEPITYQVAVLLSEDARFRLRRDPEFRPPELRGLLAYQLGRPQRVPGQIYGGRQYEVHVFQRALFAVAPGKLSIPASSLSYALSRTPGYYSREERFAVQAESLSVVVEPLPEEDRPADFTGAVGVLQLGAKLDSTTTRSGDPVVLTVTVSGAGNVKLFPRPDIEIPWASVVSASDRVRVDSLGSRVRGSREFDYILTPVRSGNLVLPALHYSYFDPDRGVYAVAESAPVELRVLRGDMADIPALDEEASLALREWSGHQAFAPWEATRSVRLALVTLWLGGIAWMVLTWLFTLKSFGARVVAQRAPGSDSRSYSESDPRDAVRRSRQMLLQQMASRLSVPASRLLVRSEAGRALRYAGVSNASTNEVLMLLDDMARAGFGSPQEADLAGLENFEPRIARARQLIDEEATNKPIRLLRSARGWRQLSLAFAVLALGAAGPRSAAEAQPAEPERTATAKANALPGSTNIEELVAEANAAYADRRFQAASASFKSAVASRPNDVDLLVNWGSSAWAVGDTVDAVVAWQRAARLSPLSADIQERITLLPGGARDGVAAVPMVPVLGLVWAGSIAWLFAVVLVVKLIKRSERRPSGLIRTPVALSVMAAAVSMLALAWWGAVRLSPVGLAVVKRPEPMRSAASAESGTKGGLAAGDVVRVTGVSGEWARVTHSDGRDGWVPGERLVSLLPDAASR